MSSTRSRPRAQIIELREFFEGLPPPAWRCLFIFEGLGTAYAIGDTKTQVLRTAVRMWRKHTVERTAFLLSK